MEVISLILSGLALLAAVANIILYFVEKKRADRRHKAMLNYIGNTCDGTQRAAERFTREYIKEFFDNEKELFKTENNEFFIAFSKNVGERFDRQQQDIDNLKSGACPDYERALAAANAVNDFNAGISAIMNFDPIAAVKARRQGGDKEVG